MGNCFFSENIDSIQEPNKINDVILPLSKQKTLKKIIIVDDVISMAQRMKKYYEMLDYEVTVLCAGSGEECLQLCELHKDIDLIFMDLIMYPMDGYTTAEKILKDPRNNIYVIAMSGLIDAESISRCREMGMLNVFEKPVNYDDVVQRLHKMGLNLK